MFPTQPGMIFHGIFIFSRKEGRFSLTWNSAASRRFSSLHFRKVDFRAKLCIFSVAKECFVSFLAWVNGHLLVPISFAFKVAHSADLDRSNREEEEEDDDDDDDDD